jgi:hypothetical protein
MDKAIVVAAAMFAAAGLLAACDRPSSSESSS